MRGGANKIDMTGRVYQGIIVQEFAGHNECGQRQWHCICPCGIRFRADGHALRRGQTKSCGCRTYLSHLSHKKTGTAIYKVWAGMVSRCKNASNNCYPNYGAKGVVVCERWLSFESFYADMGDPPFPRATLDRIDNSKGYEPDNVRWASYSQQARNKSTNKFVEHQGRVLCIADWAKEFGVHRATMTRRIQRYGSVVIPA